MDSEVDDSCESHHERDWFPFGKAEIVWVQQKLVTTQTQTSKLFCLSVGGLWPCSTRLTDLWGALQSKCEPTAHTADAILSSMSDSAPIRALIRKVTPDLRGLLLTYGCSLAVSTILLHEYVVMTWTKSISVRVEKRETQSAKISRELSVTIILNIFLFWCATSTTSSATPAASTFFSKPRFCSSSVWDSTCVPEKCSSSTTC